MCLGRPSIPPPPPPPQEAKAPDTVSAVRATRKQSGFGNGTVLTGASGVSSGSMNTGGSTLLGG